MIHLKRELIDQLHDERAVRKALQNAVELEHATIPAYLTALYSLVPGQNAFIERQLSDIAREEMLHMALACNILNAIGGAPVIDRPNFIRTYPGTLPGSVQTGLVVPLKRFSLELVREVFMEIEEPEEPLPIPCIPGRSSLSSEIPPPQGITIGQFYHAILERLRELGNAIFTGDSNRQVDAWFVDDILPVIDLASAERAITTIVEQGEGTRRSPLDPAHQLAHYYRFAEILCGRELVRDSTGFEFKGPAIPFDSKAVYPMKDNPKSSDYPDGSNARLLSDRFNCTYTALLRALHRTFNGQPDYLKHAMGTMASLKLLAGELMQTELQPGVNAGPTFEYLPVIRNS